MYQIENSGTLLKSRGKLIRRRYWPHVSRTVLFLGLTSMFTDISSEMVSTILPLYLVFTLRLTPLEFGIVDGLYQGAAALVRVASGFVADRWRRHKEVAGVGYAISAFCKLGFLAAGGVWTFLAGVVLLDRTGKGIRTAPRDALISLSSPPEGLGTAFGVHRALDTAGAMLGPLLAFGLLALAPGAFDVVFVVSFCFALVGVGLISLFVENIPTTPANGESPHRISLKAAVDLLRAPYFRRLVVIGAALSLATLSDGFLYLGLQRRLNFSLGYLPLLYVATALAYMLLAVPIGRLADRIGRGRVFIAGYGLLLLTYTSLLLPSLGTLQVIVYVLLFGAYYAATDGVLMAMASAVLSPPLRGSGLAIVTTATSLSRLFASVLFGMLWTWWGVETAVVVFLVALAVVVVFAAIVLLRGERPEAPVA
jgi:MFS family permease